MHTIQFRLVLASFASMISSAQRGGQGGQNPRGPGMPRAREQEKKYIVLVTLSGFKNYYYLFSFCPFPGPRLLGNPSAAAVRKSSKER